MSREKPILSYHQFVETPIDYKFSRTYEQFYHDIRKKEYSLITIDDAMICCIKACEMMRDFGIRAKLFVPTSLVGKEGYCTWDQLRELSHHHDIENHGHLHEWHTQMSYPDILGSIHTAQQKILLEIGKNPKYFVSPYNAYDDDVYKAVEALGLIPMDKRLTVANYYK